MLHFLYNATVHYCTWPKRQQANKMDVTGCFRHEVTLKNVAEEKTSVPAGMWQQGNTVHSVMTALHYVRINCKSSALMCTNGSAPFGTWLKSQTSADARGLQGHSMVLDNIWPVNPIMDVRVSVA